MSQQFPWSSSSQQQSGRRGLTPISTANTSNPPGAGISNTSPTRSTFSPLGAAFPNIPPSSTRHVASRNSSASSANSPYTIPQAGSQQPPGNQLLASVRSRTIQSASNLPSASSAAALSSASQGGGGAPGSGGGATKLARASPSLSQPSTVASPNAITSSSSAPSGQSLSKIVIAQVFLLLSSLKEDKDKVKWETQADQIRRLIDSNGMEVFSKYFRRLLQGNASQIFPGPGRGSEPGGSYPILVSEMHKITQDPQQAYKIAESVDTTEGDLFRDFDLSTFMEHFKLDALAKTTLALAFKTASKQDLRTKADAILFSNLQNFVLTVAGSTPEGKNDISPAFLASIIDRLMHDPPRNWNEESRSQIVYALRLRYQNLNQAIPTEITSTLYLGELLASENSIIKALQRMKGRSTVTADSVKDMLTSAGIEDISPSQIASALLFIVITQGGELYNTSNFVSGLKDYRGASKVDWEDVLHSFDRDGLRITKQQFITLYNGFLPLAQDNDNFDIQHLWGGPRWEYPETQLSFVVAFLSCTVEELDASTIPRLRKAFTEEQFEDASEEVRAYVAQAVKKPLVSADATSALFSMIFQSPEDYQVAQSMGIPETVINTNTDIFIVAASAAPKPWLGLQEQAMRQLFNPFFMKSLPHYDFVMHGLWKQDAQALVSRFIESYNLNQLNLQDILDHAQTHNWIESLVSVGSDMSVDLAALAHGRGLIDLESWAQQMFQQLPQLFPRILATFLSAKAENDLQSQKDEVQPVTMPLAVKTVYPLLGLLQGHLSDEDLVQLQRTCIQAYPRLVNYGEGFDEIIDANGRNGNAASKSADEKMQQHFKELYNNEIDVRDIVSALRRYKSSENPDDQELFACMIHGLFDEYSCFAEYPIDALATTAVLFGGIINYNLLSRIALQAGLAMVLEAVQDGSPGEPMYRFGVQALLHFLDRLPEWPSFCDRLSRVPSLQGSEIWKKVEQVVDKQREELGGESQNGLGLTNGSNVDDFLAVENAVPNFSCIFIDPPLRSEFYEHPEEQVQDKVLFVLNNVSVRNLKEKMKDLEEALEDKHHQWFAEYLVEERAKVQPNFQQLYLEMLQMFNDKVLWAEVLRETFVSVIRLLNSEATMNSSMEKSHLKNLGEWLGLITIARDKPIKFRNISFKDLLLEAHDSQRLLIVIPFTCKVFLQAAKSTVFKSPNPWVMEIIGLLMELYHFADLKLNLKFDIELLCKGLGLDHKKVEPSETIRSRQTHEEEFFDPTVTNGLEGFSELSLVGLNRARGPSGRFSPAAITANLPDFSSQLVYPPSSGNNPAQTRLRQIFFAATQHAIGEIIAPVVERSVTIAAISTSQLVAKDFAMEPDENKMRDAAYTVVKALSGSLALVTCKEPLRMSIMNNIRLMSRELPEQTLPEGLILMFVNDNLDIVCNIVEHAAEMQSISEIDMQLDEFIRARRSYRNSRSTEPFKDPMISQWAFFIPEPYKQTPGGLNSQQLAIYEDFGRLSRGLTTHGNTQSQESGRQVPDVLQDQFPAGTNLPTPAEAPALPRQTGLSGRMMSVPPNQASATQPHLNGFIDSQTLNDRLLDLLVELQHVARDAPEERIEDLPQIAPTRTFYEQILNLIQNAGTERDSLALNAAGRTTSFIFSEAEKRLEVEVMVRLLANFCQFSSSTARQVIVWLSSIDDDRVFNAAVMVNLLATGLADIHRVDSLIAKAIQQRRTTALEFLSSLVDEVLLNDQPSVMRADFAMSVDALVQWATEEPELEFVKQMTAKLQVQETLSNTLLLDKKDNLEYIFEEWILLQRPDTPEKLRAVYIHQLYQKVVIQSMEDMSRFLRICLDMSVSAYELEEKLNPMPNLENAYTSIDALAQLLVALVKYSGEINESLKESKSKFFDTILSTIILIMCSHHQSKAETFNQKIFFRLFSAMICCMNDLSGDGSDSFKDSFLILGRAFLALQPRFLPGFAFGWLSLIAHRMFIPAMLKSGDDTGRELFTKLTEALLSYTGDLLQPPAVKPINRDFYRGVLRILLVVHHDFPEFLAENHFRLCNSIPVHCTQLRNLVVSAYPSTFPELPDPFAPSLKVDRLDEMRKPPIVLGDFQSYLQDQGMSEIVDGVLQSGIAKSEDIFSISQAIDREPDEAKEFGLTPISVDGVLLHALVMYVATKAIPTQDANGPVFKPTAFATVLLEALAKELRPEARYFLISAISNQLRWPNSHTNYFSALLIHLFGNPTGDQQNFEVQQTITRVLLERLHVHRPHPWGLLYTLLAIIRNSNYSFWELPFIKAAPEVERLFGSLFSQIHQSPRALV